MEIPNYNVNAGMFIGFTERASFVRENMIANASVFQIERTIKSLRESEKEFTVNVIVLGNGATVTDSSNQMGMWDVSFESHGLYTNVPNQDHHLRPGDTDIVIPGSINNDIISEPHEKFSLTLVPHEAGVDELKYECYGDNEDPVEGKYFCSHTITIVDDDGQFHVIIDTFNGIVLYGHRNILLYTEYGNGTISHNYVSYLCTEVCSTG